MKRALPLLFLALSSCATPAMRSCLTREQYELMKQQEPPKVHDKLTGDADKDIRPIAGSNVALRAWGHGLLGMLEICSR